MLSYISRGIYPTQATYLLGFKSQNCACMISTRGNSSTSNDLKEALCEKIPVHYDLVRKFRHQYGPAIVGQVTVDDLYRGLRGVNTIVRETSELDKKFGIKYRGLTIPQVISLLPKNRGTSPSPEAVFWLLLTGDVPTQEQTKSLIADWTSRRQRLKEWWSDNEGGTIGMIIRSLPKNVTPLGKLCIALTALNADKYAQEATKTGAMSHTQWEYIFEDCMELLATLPAIIGLVSSAKSPKSVPQDGDWVDFLLDCLGNISHAEESRKSSLADFLRLYIALNADEDGGLPATHVTQILADSQVDVSQALAGGFLAYKNEPKAGSLLKCMDFQLRLQNILGQEPANEILKNFLRSLAEKSTKIPGYGESEFCDPRFLALREFLKEHVSYDSEIKLSQEISKVLSIMLRKTKGKSIWPKQNAIAAPAFRAYGLRDMEFNQVFLCMSRALGAVASIIWSRAMCTPEENPKSNSTYTYCESLQEIRKKPTKLSTVKYTKYLPK
ncbi:citrate synthase, mitochondrial [Cephus cinctus]|uniref:Citrate synthase, mitochondrial n=1 Tax=Cephus cinctus TaxID=211228 RepID=A0AAJ7FHX5_CEPCN|nr:citrate synthase, mitochondrial [Cephus cinctus]